MLQNDITENDNDGFIIPATPITPAAGSSPTNPLSPRRTRSRGISMSVPTLDRTERGGEQFISYRQKFLSRYWNHFPQHITQVLGACTKCMTRCISNWVADPALVFGEILGVIKGSEETIGTRHRCLDRDTYLSSGRQGMFSRTKEAVYDLFEIYTKLKRQHQEYDAADRSVSPECSCDGRQLNPAPGHITY